MPDIIDHPKTDFDFCLIYKDLDKNAKTLKVFDLLKIKHNWSLNQNQLIRAKLEQGLVGEEQYHNQNLIQLRIGQL